MVDLSKLVKTGGVQKFFFVDTLGGIDTLPPDASDEEKEDAVFWLELEHISQRETKRLMGEGVSRKAARKGGGKAFIESEEKFRERLGERALKSWNMTVGGAYALEFQGDLSSMDRDTPIEFTDENIRALMRNSNLAGAIYMVLNDHEAWFHLKGDDAPLATFGSGPSTSSED